METEKTALDEDSALRVVEECYADVLAYCRRHAKSREEAEEITQEAFLRFEALDAREREAVELRYDQGLGIGDIATIMGVSRFAVNRLIKKALAQLRREITSGNDERQHR